MVRKWLVGALVWLVILSALPTFAFAQVVPAPMAGKDEIGPVEVSAAVQSDVSIPLRDMGGQLSAGTPDEKEKKEKPLKVLPNNGNAYNYEDGSLQSAAGPLVNASGGLSFAGIGQGDYGFSVQYAPPDTVGAVGATQYVQWVNVAYAVFNKSNGSLALGPVDGRTLWKGFGGGCEANNDGDPIVQYDKAAQRWVLTQFSVSTLPYLQCVAVSTSSDATGSYYRYAFSYGNTQFNDYPKMGVWPDGYYITYNIFNNGQTFGGPKVCAFDRTKMLAGDPTATQQCFQLSTSYGGLLPADLDGSTQPPAGSPGYFVSYGTNSLNLWQMKVNWSTPASTTLTGPTVISVPSFSALSGAVVPQPGTTQKLDSLGDRLMYRLAYRNFGTYESMVVNHSVSTGSGRKTASGGVRWYELRKTGAGAWAVNQASTFAPDATWRWMGSIAQDKQGNMALGYSASSSSVYPSVRYTGRLATDALNTMQAETNVKTGSGSQQRSLSRWGDYSAMTVDPVDDCTFWFTTEYLATNGTWNWKTWITSFKFPGCQ